MRLACLQQRDRRAASLSALGGSVIYGDMVPTLGKTTTREQDGVRLLMLLRHACDDKMPDDAPPTAVAAIAGEQRLQAMDFWLRNPDYLAEELLDFAQAGGDSTSIADARRILYDEEPDLRTYPMLRYRHGAWERLDESLSLLTTYGLAKSIRRGEAQQGRRDFFLLEAGRAAADELPTRVPAVSWYAERAVLVRRVASSEGGTALKLRQKLQAEYLDTEWHDHIASIRARVLARLEELGE